MSPLVAAASPPAGGAPLGQVIGATVAGMLLTAGAARHRPALPGGPLPAARHDRPRRSTWLLRVPAGRRSRWPSPPARWSSPAPASTGTSRSTSTAAAIPGPFGTPAHFPILIGLFGIFASGWLALVMARGRDAARTGDQADRDVGGADQRPGDDGLRRLRAARLPARRRLARHLRPGRDAVGPDPPDHAHRRSADDPDDPRAAARGPGRHRRARRHRRRRRARASPRAGARGRSRCRAPAACSPG